LPLKFYLKIKKIKENKYMKEIKLISLKFF
jgi:hypothetical protein